ncbi:MAG: hypothetical protein R3B48_09600 [Kofleriaceae bacterium]
MSRGQEDRGAQAPASTESARVAQPQRAPGKATRSERGAASSPASAASAPTRAAAGEDHGGERAGDWHADEGLLAAMGLGDLSSSSSGAPEAAGSSVATGATAKRGGGAGLHAAALVAAGEDRAARAKDPVVLYLTIHSNAVARAVAAMLREHEEEWPQPASELTWADAAGFTRALARRLCPVVRDDSFALFSLVHPLHPDDAYRRHVADARVARTTWLPGFGDAVAAQVKVATFTAITRLGLRFQAAAQAGHGEPPEAAQILTSHPLDTYVRRAMSVEGVLDFSTVWRPAVRKGTAAKGSRETASKRERRSASHEGATGERPVETSATNEQQAASHESARNEGQSASGSGEKKARPALTVQWLGQKDATLWNYVRVSPTSATEEDVAAALYGSPAQSRMAFVLQRHGDLFQVAPKYARELIASRYPDEVTGHGTARDGAALARSAIGDEQARLAASPAPGPSSRASSPLLSTTSAAPPASRSPFAAPSSPSLRSSPNTPSPLDDADEEPSSQLQLWTLHALISGDLERLRVAVAPLGLAARLEPAFAFRARTALAARRADENEQRQWAGVWRDQHQRLASLSPVVLAFAEELQATPPPPATRATVLRARLVKALTAVSASHLPGTSAAVLAELAAEEAQARLDEATDSQIGLRDAQRHAAATPGQRLQRGGDEADAALTRAQAQVLRGEGAVLEEAQLTVDELALRTRMETVRLALLDLSLAADEAGHGLSAQLAACCSGRFRSLPSLIDAVQRRLLLVEGEWAKAERKASTFDVVTDEQEDARNKLHARAVGLQAASKAFSQIAHDQDIGTFLRDAQRIVSSQQFRSGIVKLVGALALTVVTSGLASELGAGLAGLVGGGEAGGAIAGGTLVARTAGALVNVGVNVTVNSALQVAMSEGHDSMGWALVENTLMELGTRGLALALKGPMSQLRALEQQALRDGQRLRELASMERAAARRGVALEESLTQERHALAQARADRAGWFVADLSLEMVMGMATQWAARALMQQARGHGAGAPGVSDDLASEVLQQGAAIMLGKRLAGLKSAWQARRAELEVQAWFAKLPEARALLEQRTAFFGEASRLAHSASPEPNAGLALLARHEELVRMEHALVERGEATSAAGASQGAPHGTHAEPALRSADGEGHGTVSDGAHGASHVRADESRGPRARADEGHDTRQQAAGPSAEARPTEASPSSPRTGDAKTEGPIGLFGADTRVLAAAKRLPPLPGYVDVFIHANAETFVVRRLDADVTLTPHQFASYLRTQGLAGRPLRLVGCSSGAHANAVAQRLADTLGVEVLAPTHDIWIGAHGEHGIGSRVGENIGKWEPFQARKRDNAPAKEPREPTPFEQERHLRETEYDFEAPEATYTPHVDQRARMASASSAERAAVQTALGAPVVVVPELADGVRVLARRVPRLFGFDLVVHEVQVGQEATVADVQAHARTIADLKRYNGVVGNLRELRERLLRSVSRWMGRGAAAKASSADAAMQRARGEGAAGQALEELPFLYPRGSRGWVTEVELRKLHSLLEARKSPLHQGVVDPETLRDEIAFLEGRRLLHEEVLRSMDETQAHGAADSGLSLERPDTGEVTREALSQGYRLPGPEEGARPEWYYYRSSTTLPGQYELARRPSSPNSAPGFRARVVGDTFTGFEPLGAAAGTEIPHTLSAKEVVDHLRATPGIGNYLSMLEKQGLASAAVVDGVIQHKFNLLGMSGKRVTTEALRADVRDHFRERVREHLLDPSLSDTESWQRFRGMRADLLPTERGYLAEIWVRGRYLPGSEGQRRVDVLRTSGVDEGKLQRRVVDAVEGDTAIEIKDIIGLIDQDQFAAYLDMLKAPDDGSAPLFKKVKYVFTNPEGAIANLEFMALAMSNRRVQGKLTVECFDRQGRKHVVRSSDDAMRLLATMKASP